MQQSKMMVVPNTSVVNEGLNASQAKALEQYLQDNPSSVDSPQQGGAVESLAQFLQDNPSSPELISQADEPQSGLLLPPVQPQSDPIPPEDPEELQFDPIPPPAQPLDPLVLPSDEPPALQVSPEAQEL